MASGAERPEHPAMSSRPPPSRDVNFILALSSVHKKAKTKLPPLLHPYFTHFHAAFPIRFFVTIFTKLNSDASNSPITVNTPPMIAHIDVANR